MSQLSKLPAPGRRACIELADASPWSAEEWARSFWVLHKAGVFPLVGLEHVQGLSAKHGIPPRDAAELLVEAAFAETAKRSIEILDSPPT